MKVYEAERCDGAYRRAAKDIMSEGQFQPSRTQPTKELLHVTFSIDNPRERVVFARPINPAFAIVEVLWILGGRRDEEYLHFWNPRMSRWSDDDGNLSGYGYPLRHHFETDQLRQAAETLRTDPESRQVVLQIWDSTIDMPNPTPRGKDVPCNISSHLLLRNGELDWLQIMRSNDLIWGTPYNFIQFTILQEILAGWIDAEVGVYEHLSNSLHIYKRHWDHARTIPKGPTPNIRNTADLRLSLDEWSEIEAELVDLPVRLERAHEVEQIHDIVRNYAHLPDGYFEWVPLLAAEALRRRGNLKEAQDLISEAGQYWATSWRHWATN